MKLDRLATRRDVCFDIFFSIFFFVFVFVFFSVLCVLCPLPSSPPPPPTAAAALLHFLFALLFLSFSCCFSFVFVARAHARHDTLTHTRPHSRTQAHTHRHRRSRSNAHKQTHTHTHTHTGTDAVTVTDTDTADTSVRPSCFARCDVSVGVVCAILTQFVARHAVYTNGPAVPSPSPSPSPSQQRLSRRHRCQLGSSARIRRAGCEFVRAFSAHTFASAPGPGTLPVSGSLYGSGSICHAQFSLVSRVHAATTAPLLLLLLPAATTTTTTTATACGVSRAVSQNDASSLVVARVAPTKTLIQTQTHTHTHTHTHLTPSSYSTSALYAHCACPAHLRPACFSTCMVPAVPLRHRLSCCPLPVTAQWAACIHYLLKITKII